MNPQGKIYLCNAPFKNDYKNQLKFSSLNNQNNYFTSIANKSYSDYNYMRKDRVIVVDDHIDNIINNNYLFYQNTGKTTKWYYCFITSMEYVNDSATRIFIETDVWQTWCFNLNFNTCFVEREHVNSDSVGNNTVPENVETGSYIASSSVNLYGGANATYIAISSTWQPPEVDLNTATTEYNGVYSGTSILVFDEPLGASNYLRAMDELGKNESVTGVFLIPTELAGSVTWKVTDINVGSKTITTKLGKIPLSSSVTTLATSPSITRPSTIDGYTPKNNKLFTYPYNYFYVSNNVGSDVEFKYEDFISNVGSFKTVGSLTPGCSIRCVPLNYKKLSDSGSSLNSYNSGITGAKYPICSWSSDVYTNWLTQNGVNMGLSVVGSTIAIAGGIGLMMTGAGAMAGAGAVAGGVLGIANTLAKNYEHSFTPPQAQGNQNAGDVTFSANKMNIPAYKMTIRSEYARIIDEYFTMFGYKINRVKKPNLTGRANWNFIKTIDCNFTGNIPQDDLTLIRTIFDAGITLWHNPNNIYNYSANNDII